MIRRVILLLCWGVVCSASGQVPYFRDHALGDAASGMTIHDMVQDRQGMIWLATSRGMMAYDGLRVHPVLVDSAMTGVPVTALFEDTAGRLWAGTSEGWIFWLDASRRYVPFDPEEGSPAKTITGIAEDSRGQLWFATYGEGAYVYNGQRIYNLNGDDGLSGDDVYDIEADANGDIWLATDNGISICSFHGEEKRVRRVGRAEGLPDQLVTRLLAGRKGDMWIGTFEAGVVRYDAGRNRVIEPIAWSRNDEITALALFDGRELWVGTRGAGLWRANADGGDLRPVVVEGLLPAGGHVVKVLADSEGNLWSAMGDGRLMSAYRPFERMPGPEADIQSLLCDRKDGLWVGTKQGLYRYHPHNGAVGGFDKVQAVGELNITDLAEDRFGNIWIGTLDKGLVVYQVSSAKARRIGSVHRLGGSTIMSLATSRDKMWLATLEGVVSFDLGVDIMTQPAPRFDLLQDPWESRLHFVFQIFVDPDDRVWFATDGNGVVVIDKDKVAQLAGNDTVPLRTVYAVTRDDRGHYWFNTPDHGLVEYDGKTYRPLGMADGLTTLQNAACVSTRGGELLIAHDRGIELMASASRHIMYFDDEIGAGDVQPALNAFAVDTRGRVLIGGRRGIIVYTPATGTRSIHPRTRLTQVSVFGVPVDTQAPGVMRPNQNFISFHYVGLWYTSPGTVKYQYKLDGYDLEWKESRDMVASYSNLRPGDYTFHVKASENNFFLDEPAATYAFTIRQPFWRRPWFIILAVLGGGGLLYALVRAREIRSTRQAMLRREMAEAQLAALKAQINPHFLFNSFNTLITLIDEHADDPRIAIEYVEKLADFYRSMLQYREQELISLEEEWELVHHFCFLLAKRYGDNLRLHFDPPPTTGLIMPLTLQILVENAVKHNVISETRPLDIHVTVDPDGFVKVRNSLQPKSGSEPSTRFGLQSIIKRYQLLSDRQVVVVRDAGAFIVRIPIIKRSSL